jgi:stage II sporulation protein GA (sporulation sigma-E factor processing peptidase)
LSDPVSGKAVSIVSKKAAAELFGKELPGSIRYIPYRTVGRDGGVIPVVTIDGLRIPGKEEQKVEQPMIALSEEDSFGGTRDVILNPDL